MGGIEHHMQNELISSINVGNVNSTKRGKDLFGEILTMFPICLNRQASLILRSKRSR